MMMHSMLVMSQEDALETRCVVFVLEDPGGSLDFHLAGRMRLLRLGGLSDFGDRVLSWCGDHVGVVSISSSFCGSCFCSFFIGL